MVRVLGRHAGLWVAALLGLVVLGPLAVFFPGGAALIAAGAGVLAALLAHARASALSTRCDRLSREVDLLSQRVLKAEAAAPRAAPADHAPEIEELTVEIGLLSGIVRDLTAVVSAQDAEVARLKAAPAPVAVAPPAPRAVAPQFVPQVAPSAAPPPMEHRAPQEDATGPTRPAQREFALQAPPEPPVLRPVPPAGPAARPIPPRPLPPAPARETAPEEAILAAFDGEGLEVHLQPVVTLPQRKVVAYEALARLRVGDDVLAPEAFLPALERAGRTTALDRRMLERAVTIVRHLARRGSDAGVTYALSPRSLFEPDFLRGLARMTAGDAALAGLVLALPQASWRGLDAGQAAALAGLRGRVGFTLDRPDDLRFDAGALAARGVSQVKVPADLLLRPGTARRTLSDLAIEDVGPALGRAGIRLVACAVEAEADVPDLIDLDVPFAQGSAFAPPRAVRAEVLAAPPEPAPPEPGPEPEPRRPFRSFLRRAG